MKTNMTRQKQKREDCRAYLSMCKKAWTGSKRSHPLQRRPGSSPIPCWEKIGEIQEEILVLTNCVLPQMRLLSLLTQAPKARHKRDSLPENQNTLYLQVQTSHHRQLKVDHSSHHKKCNTKRGNLQEKMSERHSRRESSFSEEKSHPYYNLLAFQSLAPKIAGRIESAY